MKFKIAMVQHRITTTEIEANVDLAQSYMEEAKKEKADFVLFPECFLTAYDDAVPKCCEKDLPIEEMEHDPEFIHWCESALDEESLAIKKIQEKARELQIGVGITAFTKGVKYPQNSIFIIDRDGSILMKYSKVHTCDFVWEKYLESGERFKVCEFDGIKLGAMICYDREYPESARELMLAGAELIVAPNDCYGMVPHRLNELRAEAMQNMTGIAMANPPGKYAGCSCAFSPCVWSEEEELLDQDLVIAEPEHDGLVYAEFNLDEIRKFRAREDLGKYRKPQAYNHLDREADYYVVDAFAEEVFTGNPAGVCVLKQKISTELMQKIAFENNLSETAFVWKEKNKNKYQLKWFTPDFEIDLCGHATLATAFVILNYVSPQAKSISFDTMSGTLSVVKKEDRYEMTLPKRPAKKLQITNEIVKALGVTPKELYGERDLYVVLDSEQQVRGYRPDHEKLATLDQWLGVVVTAPGITEDFVSRYFCPELKLEDPVTGSSHSTLVPMWSKWTGKKEMVARQVSKRGGLLYVKEEKDHVLVAGKACLYLKGNLMIEQ